MHNDGPFPFRIVSGFRPLRALHIGHYAAVISDLRRLQYARRRCCFVFLADHHMRSRWDERVDFANIQNRSREIAKQLIAAGVDPDFTTVYRQSDVPEIFEMLWFLAGVIPDSRLTRIPTAANKPGSSVGMYLYPLLMVADILSLRATNAAIGEDQRTHLELAREVARKLNRGLRSNLVPIPDSLNPAPRLVRGINSSPVTQVKMDVELRNDIPLFADEDTVNDQIDAILTRPVEWSEPLPVDRCNILHYAECIGGEEAKARFLDRYRTGAYRYPDAKRDLRELYFETFREIRKIYSEIDSRHVDQILDSGGRNAREVVSEMVMEIRKIMATVI